MLITVIIPTCNSEKYLIPTLESAINQTYRNIEIIIVDDCSKDKTVSIIKKFLKIDKRIKLIKSNIKKPSGGPATPRNIGIRFAKGDYVAFLDSDDLWQKNKLALQVSSMKKNHFISFTNCNYIIENKIVKENYIRKKFIQFALSYLPEGLLLYNPIRLSTVLIKKSLLKKINFNEESEISGVEDIEMWLNYSVKKYFNNFNYLSDYLVSIRKHKRNLTKDYNIGIIKNIYCLSKFMINNPSIINFKFFLSGILFRIILLIKKNYINEIKKFTYVFFFIFLLFFLITFKSPIPDYLGTKLIVHHGNTSNIENLVIFSSSKYEKSYKKRFYEAMKVYKTQYIKNIYILGNDDAVPEHRILSSLFSTENVNKNFIKLASTNLQTTRDNIILIGNILKKDNIESVIFLTDKYRSKRSELIWNKNFPEIKIIFINNYMNEEDSNWIRNKKITYEYLAIAYNYLRGWL